MNGFVPWCRPGRHPGSGAGNDCRDGRKYREQGRSEQPSTTGGNGGRTPGGRFARGNKLAVGNPHVRKVARLRSAMLRAVTLADMRAIIVRLVTDAKAGNVQAAKEILERTLGKPQEADLLERIETLEAVIGKTEGRTL